MVDLTIVLNKASYAWFLCQSMCWSCPLLSSPRGLLQVLVMLQQIEPLPPAQHNERNVIVADRAYLSVFPTSYSLVGSRGRLITMKCRMPAISTPVPHCFPLLKM